MISVVLDTNVIIDGLTGNRLDCDKIIDYFNDRKYRTLFSQETIGELIYVSKIVANKEFNDMETKQFFLHYMSNLFFFSKSVYTLDVKGKLPIYCNDIYDDMFLECALAGNADFLVTNDYKSGLHSIDDYNFKIINSKEFLKLITDKR